MYRKDMKQLSEQRTCSRATQLKTPSQNGLRQHVMFALGQAGAAAASAAQL